MLSRCFQRETLSELTGLRDLYNLFIDGKIGISMPIWTNAESTGKGIESRTGLGTKLGTKSGTKRGTPKALEGTSP